MAVTRPFMRPSPLRDWWHLTSTLCVLAGFCLLALFLPWWPLRVLASLGMALTMTRAFILFHDVHHLAMFQDSAAGRAVLNAYGLFMLTPARIWRATHNYHHAHTARTSGKHRGAYTLYTTEQWRQATRSERLLYRMEHHPLTLVLGYVTVFFFSFGLRPIVEEPRRHVDSALSVLLHAALGVTVYALAGASAFLFVFLIPFVAAGAIGAYLFYVQHYFEGVEIPDGTTWSHERAALDASSFLRFGPVMRWFTGNIGYHHVHHLNPRIPFHRLPKAMASIPELQNPTSVTLRPRTIVASLRLKLWSPRLGRMVSYAEAAAGEECA
jgi:omega-6 fatty acid desaturase (delta-12 desaturase)